MPPPENPSSELLLQIEDKLQFLKECIEQVESQLRERQKQKQEFVRELDEEICSVQTSIYQLDLTRDHSRTSQRRTGLEREIKNLEKQKRQQELEYWRDVVELQKEFRQLKKEYRAVRTGASCLEQKKS